MKITLIIPTYYAGPLWPKVLDVIKQQTMYPDKVIVIDSGSKDDTVRLASHLENISVLHIQAKDFNHGGTRNLAVTKTLESDVIIFLTQDAILADSDAIKELVSYFSDPLIAAVCGRQLPHKDANPLAVHARNFNYSSTSIVKSEEDIEKLGIKTVFMSNSFAAYRRSVFEELGGFPEHTILAEDMFMAAKMIQAGYKVAYCAEAVVRHSHNYTPKEEFKRYFDTGVFHACNPWIQRDFGAAGGEGARFVKSELFFLFTNAPLWIPRAILTIFAKLAGYKLGKHWKSLPLPMCRYLSMYKSYWNKDQYSEPKEKI